MVDRSWMVRAACRDHVEAGEDWWHSPEVEDQMKAVAVCRQCPVLGDCRTYAAGPGRLWQHGGVAAGMTPRELARFRSDGGVS